MKMLTKALAKKLPALRETEETTEPKAVVKWFCPWGNWTWYCTEYSPETGECFGLVVGHEVELGYWSLPELESIRGPGGLKIERDLYWSPTSIKEIKAKAKGGWPSVTKCDRVTVEII